MEFYKWVSTISYLFHEIEVIDVDIEFNTRFFFNVYRHVFQTILEEIARSYLVRRVKFLFQVLG